MSSKFSDFAARLRERFFPEESLPFVSRSDASGDDFNEFALELFALQFEGNLPYRRFCESRHVNPAEVNHWRQIPAMPTSAFKEFETSCLSPPERTTVFHSSGTTLQYPSRHFHSVESLKIYETSLWSWFRARVLADETTEPPEFEFIALTPPPAKAPNSSLVYMFDCIRCNLGARASGLVGRLETDGGWAINFDRAVDFLRRATSSRQPVLLLGTAFSFVHLLDEMAKHQMSLVLPLGSRVMETGGYKGRSRSMSRSELHSFMTRLLGVPASHIVCEYGMSELSSQAYDKKVSRVKHPRSSVRGILKSRSQKRETHNFQFPPWARAQVISPETGREVSEDETGLLRIFDLANIWSVMAVQTEDLAVRRDSGFELLGRAVHAEPRGCSLMAVESSERSTILS